MKKNMISILVAVFFAFVFAGCGSKEEMDTGTELKETTQTVSTNQADTNQASTENQTTLTVWCWDAFNVYAMKDAADIYEETHPDVKIKVQDTLSSDIQTLVKQYAESGELDALPDIFLLDDQVYAKYLKYYPEVFSDLTDSGIPFDQFTKAKVANSVLDGKNYGVPYDSNTVVACYRTDYLEIAGYSIDDLTDITWDQFIEIGEDVLDKTGMPMLTNVGGEPDLLNMILQSAGISVFDKEGNISLTDNKGLKEAMNVYLKLKEKEILQEQTDWAGYQDTIQNGEVVGTINGSWICSTIMTSALKEQEGKWAVTNMPKLNNRKKATNYSAQGGSTWVISSATNHYDLAIDFFKTTWAGSTEFYDTILDELGAIATYIPAGDSDTYHQNVSFFNNEPIYAKIVSYGSKIPTINKGIYWKEEKDALGTALENVFQGKTDLDSAIKKAQSEVESIYLKE